jgi:hypothetical protein
MKIRTIAVAGICMTGLAACGGGTSTSASSTTPAASQSAVASQAAATTPAAPATASGPLAPTTTPTAPGAVSASLVPPTPGTATTATLWCGSVFGVVNAPSLSVWETGPFGYNTAYFTDIPNIQGTVASVENASTSAATEEVSGAVICAEVQTADEHPPPVDQSTYAAAMSDFLQASETLHAAEGYPAGGKARPYLEAGTKELNAFLSAIGKPGA